MVELDREAGLVEETLRDVSLGHLEGDGAAEQLEILDNLCSFNCKEYSKLKNAIDSYQQMESNS